ncbi:hypothetical protein CDD83_10399 [Cordyceps sp. RAO-2017]|nr:hypothetical protein CDD83_10399 [Cordyceps sp. RAO-2017]
MRSQEDSESLRRHISDYEESREILLQDARKQEAARKEAQYLQVMQWLASPGVSESEKAYQDQFRAVRSDHPDTGTWILSEDKISGWINAETPTHSMLWLSGKKGAGKTILASLLIDHLMQESRERKTSYFFCRTSDERLQEPRSLAIYKSLLRQLTSHNRELLPTLHDKRMKGDYSLKDEGSARSLLDLFCESDMKQFIVIDGLDELPDKQREEVVQRLKDIVRKSDDYDPGKIRVLLVSIDLADMRRLVQSADQIDVYELRAESTLRDISRYVTRQVCRDREHFSGLSDGDLQRARSSICSNSQGMFLYAFLVVDNLLRQPTVGHVVHELRETKLPDTLAEAYGRIIQRLRRDLHANSWQIARNVFGWLACAKRPLKWHELQMAISMSLDSQFQIQMPDPARRLCKDVRELCGSLIQVIGGQQIEFVHQTAQDYVLQEESLDRKVLECDIALLCLNYLSHRCFGNALAEQQRRSFADRGFYAFQDYSVSKWDSHLQFVIENAAGLFDDEVRGPEYIAKASASLARFIKTYLRRPAGVDAISDEARRHCRAFQHHSELHGRLVLVWGHVVSHQSKAFQERDKVSIEALGEALRANREMLEKLSKEPDNSLSALYGDHHFKCERVTCDFFYHGFDSEDGQKRHSDRHDRPYACSVPGCSLGPFGFSSNKDRDHHVRICHPDMADQPGAFPRLGAEAGRARHHCDLCPRSYTRRANLTAHRDSVHIGRRRFACSVCGREFTRSNDRNRHEKALHTRRRNNRSGQPRTVPRAGRR